MRERNGIENGKCANFWFFGAGPNYYPVERLDPWFHERCYPHFLEEPGKAIEGLKASLEFAKTIKASKVREICYILAAWHGSLVSTISRIRRFNAAQEWERAQSEGMP